MALLSTADRKLLEQNPNVLKVTKSNVTFTPAFKLHALKLFRNGKSPQTILIDAGINLEVFASDYARRTLERWNVLFELHGKSAFTKERRGNGSTGRPKKKFESAEDELKYLRMENEFLKKLHALAEKYQK